MQGGCGFARENGSPPGGGASDWATVLGVGATSGGNSPTLSNGDDLAVAVNLGSDIGAAATLIQRAFLSHIRSGVIDFGDTSGNLDDETFARVDSVAARRTLTLPAAAAGLWYVIQTTSSGFGVDLDDQAGDTINGGAGPIVIYGGLGGPFVWLVWAEDGTNWNAQRVA